MKQHNYEKNTFLIGIGMILFLLEIVCSLLLFYIKKYDYQKLSGVYTNKDQITVIVNKEEKKLLQKQAKLFLNNKEELFEIEEDKGILLKKGKENYYELLLKVKTPKENKRQDILEITIQKNKKNLFEIIKEVWEGDDNKNNQ